MRTRVNAANSVIFHNHTPTKVTVLRQEISKSTILLHNFHSQLFDEMLTFNRKCRCTVSDIQIMLLLAENI